MVQLIPFIDWLSLSCKLSSSSDLDKLIEYLQYRLLLEYDWTSCSKVDNYAGKWSRYNSASGSSISIKHCNGSDDIDVRLILPGQFLASNQRYYIHRTLGQMYQRWQFKCTRIDIAVDDPDKQLDYQHIIQATKDKNISGFQEGKYIESYGGDTPGMTVYCGARRSAKYARFYNKGDVDRFEIEFKLDLAHTIFIDYISSDTTRSSRLLATCLKSAISFIDKKDKNISRNTVFPWWESFISRIEGDCIKLPRVRIESSIERSMSWIQKSVSKTILKCKAALGAAEFQFNLDIWVADATQRITRLDNLHVMEYRQRVACCV